MYDSSNVPIHSRRVYGVAAILAPLLLLASTIAYIVEGEGINHGALGGVIGVWSCFAFMLAFPGILRLLEPRAPRVASLLAVLAVTGFSGGVAFNVGAIFTATAGPEADDALDVVIESNPVSLLAFLPWGLFVPLSFVLVGIFLWRSRTTAWWTGVLLVAGGVLFVASRPERINVLAMVADAVLILGLVPVGWAMLTGSRSAPAKPADSAATSALTRP